MKKFLERGCILIVALAAMIVLSGCTALSETAQKVSDDLGDKVTSGFAFVDIWKVTPSDAASNGSPSVKKTTVIGRIDTIPVVAKNGEVIKDYAKYSKTSTPAWYNSDNVTEEEIFIGTGDNAKEIAEYFKRKLEAEAEKAKASVSP